MMNIFVGGICGGVGCLVGMWYKHSVEEKLAKENEELIAKNDVLREKNGQLQTRLNSMSDVADSRWKSIRDLNEELAKYKNSEYDISQIAYMKRENERLSKLEHVLKAKVEELGEALKDTREQLIVTHHELCDAYRDAEMLWERVKPDVEESV